MASERVATLGEVRILQLLEAAEAAGLAPLDVGATHAIAYLSNVLAPVWDLRALDGKVLKSKTGPFYPALQGDLDRLVGHGMVSVRNIGHDRDDDGTWRIRADYQLNHSLAAEALARIRWFADERRMALFLRELCLALTRLPKELLRDSPFHDATFSDPIVGVGNVLDYAEWEPRNASANAANVLAVFAPGGTPMAPAERLHQYIRRLQERLVS